MNLENKLYLVIGVSIAFFLFGFAIVFNLFSDNFLIALIMMLIITTMLCYFAALYISEEIDPVELDRKGAFIGACIFITISIFTFILLILYFPGDLVAFLIGEGIAILVSLVITYVSIRELQPLFETKKVEKILGILIFSIGFLFIVVYYLNNLMIILLITGLCFVLYLFIFLVIQFRNISD